MQNPNPQKVALSTSIVVSIIVTVSGVLLWQFLDETNDILSIIIISAITFLSSFILFRYAIEQFIYRKIKLIFKIIHDSKSPKSTKKDVLDNLPMKENILDKVNQEVEEWASENEKEIDQLRQLESYRKEFIGNISHELKTPIFNIQGYILTLLDGGLEDPAINRNYLERSEKSVERLINIVQNLEAITKLESGELTLDLERFNIVKLVNEIFEALELKAGEKAIKLSFKEEYEKPVWVLADKDVIRQVVTNLAVNSIKYGKEKGSSG